MTWIWIALAGGAAIAVQLLLFAPDKIPILRKKVKKWQKQR